MLKNKEAKTKLGLKLICRYLSIPVSRGFFTKLML